LGTSGSQHIIKYILLMIYHYIHTYIELYIALIKFNYGLRFHMPQIVTKHSKYILNITIFLKWYCIFTVNICRCLYMINCEEVIVKVSKGKVYSLHVESRLGIHSYKRRIEQTMFNCRFILFSSAPLTYTYTTEYYFRERFLSLGNGMKKHLSLI